MRRGVFAGAVIAVATIALPGAVRAVTQTTVTCGQVITKSIVVANDLSGCTGNGLSIGAAGITLNLNGKTIAGDGSGGGNGIDDGGSFSKLTIENGSVTGFVSGISVFNGSKLKVSGVSSYANTGKGIVADGTVGVTIENSYTHGNPAVGIDVVENVAGPIAISGVGSNGDEEGLQVTGGPLTLSSSVFANEGDIAITETGNGFKITNNRVVSAAGGGISAEGTGTISGNTVGRAGTVGIASSGGKITGNTIGVTQNVAIEVSGAGKATVTDNHIGASSDGGIDVSEAGAGSTIEDNVISFASTSPGIHANVDGITIKGNTIGVVSDGGNGIAVQGNAVTIANNRVDSASSTGISITGSHDTVSGNVVANAGTGEGFFITAASSKIASNTVLAAGDNGMYIDAVAGDLIQGNVLEGAAHDGLRVDPGGNGHTIKGNTAHGNNEIGIHDESGSGSILSANVAVDNVTGISTDNGTDGGKNKAAGNVNDPQCAGVVCTAP